MQDYNAFMQRFIDAWQQKDVEALMSMFTEDAEYTNIPMDPPNIGHDMIRGFIEGFLGSMDSIEFEVHRQIVQGNTVMNERTDHIVMDGKQIALRVMGVFEFEGDRIKLWRDYFDISAFTS